MDLIELDGITEQSNYKILDGVELLKI